MDTCVHLMNCVHNFVFFSYFSQAWRSEPDLHHRLREPWRSGDGHSSALALHRVRFHPYYNVQISCAFPLLLPFIVKYLQGPSSVQLDPPHFVARSHL